MCNGNVYMFPLTAEYIYMILKLQYQEGLRFLIINYLWLEFQRKLTKD